MSLCGSTFDTHSLRRELGRLADDLRLVVLAETDSTNEELRRMARAGAPSWTVVIADTQHAGRGRLGRHWHSPPGRGLYLSVLIRPARPVPEPARYTIAASVAACGACHDVGAPDVVIKWPNDLLLHRRKLAGALTELRSSGTRVDELIVGTGFNVADDPGHAALEATSLEGVGLDPHGMRERLASAYLARLAEVLGRLERGEWQAIRASWHGLAPAAVGRPVVVPRPGGEEGATTAGLAPSGALRIRLGDGRLVEVHDGDRVRFVEKGPCC